MQSETVKLRFKRKQTNSYRNKWTKLPKEMQIRMPIREVQTLPPVQDRTISTRLGQGQLERPPPSVLRQNYQTQRAEPHYMSKAQLWNQLSRCSLFNKGLQASNKRVGGKLLKNSWAIKSTESLVVKPEDSNSSHPRLKTKSWFIKEAQVTYIKDSMWIKEGFSHRKWASRVQNILGLETIRSTCTATLTVKARLSRIDKTSTHRRRGSNMSHTSPIAVRSTLRSRHSWQLMPRNFPFPTQILEEVKNSWPPKMNPSYLAKSTRTNLSRQLLTIYLGTTDALEVLVKHRPKVNLKSFATLVKTITPRWKWIKTWDKVKI
jgi:hypothetical protein